MFERRATTVLTSFAACTSFTALRTIFSSCDHPASPLSSSGISWRRRRSESSFGSAPGWSITTFCCSSASGEPTAGPSASGTWSPLGFSPSPTDSIEAERSRLSEAGWSAARACSSFVISVTSSLSACISCSKTSTWRTTSTCFSRWSAERTSSICSRMNSARSLRRRLRSSVAPFLSSPPGSSLKRYETIALTRIRQHEITFSCSAHDERLAFDPVSARGRPPRPGIPV